MSNDKHREAIQPVSTEREYKWRRNWIGLVPFPPKHMADAFDAKERAEGAERDAARWQELRSHHWFDSSPETLVVTKGKNVRLGSDCPYGDRLDAAIDAVVKDKR